MLEHIKQKQHCELISFCISNLSICKEGQQRKFSVILLCVNVTNVTNLLQTIVSTISIVVTIVLVVVSVVVSVVVIVVVIIIVIVVVDVILIVITIVVIRRF